MIALLRLIVEFTPTQKDDELLAQAEAFLKDNPELIPLVMKILFAAARSKS